jgi:hypothetical protein
VTDFEALAKWALGRGVGMSSRCIARHMIGLETDGSYPHDGGDFDRCEALLNAVPGLRERLPEMAAVNAYWAKLVPAWGEIAAAKDRYAAIEAITRPVEDRDPRVVRLSESVTMTFSEGKRK